LRRGCGDFWRLFKERKRLNAEDTEETQRAQRKNREKRSADRLKAVLLTSHLGAGLGRNGLVRVGVELVDDFAIFLFYYAAF
jgi:hypothetical protein